ncbi:MAG: DUF1592 domain-containing protein [Deltaproteobacteria bacterium]|nr:DUF1592 domain-containing protein [Deltaproteobacteria bacterium]
MAGQQEEELFLRAQLFTALIVTTLVSGCSGAAGSPSEGDEADGGSGGGASGGTTAPPPEVVPKPRDSACAGAAPKPGIAGLRKLTPFEYDNTVEELLRATTKPGASFPASQLVLGFDNNADAVNASTLAVEQYQSAAETLALAAVKDLPKLMGCNGGSAAAEDTCAKSFIKSFGLHAFRRPLTTAELDRFTRFYMDSKAPNGFTDSVRMLVEAFLQSPHFLYRVEGAAKTGSVAAPYALASRLSYLIWSSMPDETLFAAAASGRLKGAGDVALQAQRMLADDRAKRGVNNFFGQWLELSRVQRLEKDAEANPTWTPAIAGLLRQETEAYVQDQVLGGKGNLKSLLTDPHSFINADLAKFYGLQAPAGSGFGRVNLNPKQRAGLLTQGALLAAAAKPRQSSPVARGYFVRDRLLCSPPPPPPANVNAKLPEPDGTATTRQRLESHRTDPSCRGCHELLDPVGLGFEHYDAVGLWRDQDEGKPVDATGKISSAGDADGAFDGAIELATKLAGSQTVQACFAKQFFRFAFARGETDDDACTLDALSVALGGNDATFARFIATLTQTDPFMYETQAGVGQ